MISSLRPIALAALVAVAAAAGALVAAPPGTSSLAAAFPVAQAGFVHPAAAAS